MDIDATVRSEVLDAIANGIFVVDADARVLVWNRWMVEYSGIAADIAIGQSIRTIFPDVVGTRFENALQQALSYHLAGLLSPSIHRSILPLYRNPDDRHRDQRMQQLINLTPIRLVSVPACAVHVQDMTAAVLRERRLREQAGELARSNATLRAKLDEIEALQVRLDDMRQRDALTGVYNRAYLNDVLEHQLSLARHEGKPLSVVLLDIDHLKKINETYGQQAGDEVIRVLGSQLLSTLAETQIIACRHGGDEFMMVLPGIEIEMAARLAEQWRSHIAGSHPVFGNFGLQATVTAGVAGYPRHGKTAEELSQCASLAAYLGKHDGGNRVVVFDPGTS
jgi:diguanylate cyclase (GGDEF)-like protein